MHENDSFIYNIKESVKFKLSFLLLKWIFISTLLGSIIGSVVAWFLISLDFVTEFREINSWIIYILPIGGLIMGIMNCCQHFIPPKKWFLLKWHQ